MAARKIDIEFSKTYATSVNAEKAVDKIFGKRVEDLRYMIVPVLDADGIQGNTRYGVLFVGMDAIKNMVHFHFNVVG